MAFPTSPSNDDLHTEFGRTFKYSSASNSWSVATPDAPEDNALTTQGYVDVQSLPLTDVAAGSKAFVQDGNKLFIFTGSGWFEIATINTAPTITAGADATYTLNSDGTPTVITLQATDPEGTPIIWGYQVTSGSLEDSSITNVGGEFTITPGTVDATFNLTFTASDGINIDTSASSFTLFFAPPDWSATTLVQTLDNPNPYDTSLNDNFGWSVSISGNYAIVSTPYEDDAGGNSSGKAYIFDVTTGSLVHTLDNPNAYGTIANDYFGQSVGISGNYAIVGAYTEDDAGGNNSGKAYIFDITTGSLVHTLDNPNDYGTSASDLFGGSVAISGNYAIVGAYNEADSGGTSSGKSYIFDVTAGTLLHTLDNPNAYTTSIYDYFGRTVAISGNYAIVGAPGEDDVITNGSDENGGTQAGKAYIFDVTTGSLVHTLDHPNAYGSSVNDQFGDKLAISGNYAIAGVPNDGEVGSGRAFIFDVTTGALLHTLDNPNAYIANSNDQFGTSVAISGNYAIVSAPYEYDAGGTYSGKAYIFDVTSGALVMTLDNPNAYDTSASDQFGRTVAISDNYAILCTPYEDDAGGTGSGKAYIFKAG
jgi:hypothetical protein